MRERKGNSEKERIVIKRKDSSNKNDKKENDNGENSSTYQKPSELHRGLLQEQQQAAAVSLNEEDESHGLVMMSIDDQSALSLDASLCKEGSWQETLAGVAGNVLEWYDFAVFGYFNDVISDVFFPEQSGNMAMVQSFCVFGGAFLMRPLGGMMMGYIGDKYNHKRALELSIFLMAFPTFAMGCLPGYVAVGWIAPLLLTFVRLLQGLSVGGQLMSSLVFTLENHPRSVWGFYGSTVMATSELGTLIGGIVGFILKSTLSDHQLFTWGWRLPFLLGITASIPGFYLKNHCHEHHNPAACNTNPIVEAFKPQNLRALVSASLVPMIFSGGFYLSFVWMAIFMEDLIEPPIPNAFLINCLSLFFSVFLIFPLAGLLSDLYGRRPVMTIGGLGIAFLGPFMVYTITLSDALAAFTAQCSLGITLSLWGAPMCAWLVEGFPPQIRLTAVAIGYNLAHAIAGGLSPALATLLVDQVSETGPGIIYLTFGVLSLIGLYIAPPHPLEHYHNLGRHSNPDDNTAQNSSAAFEDVAEELPQLT